ncbi:MAG: hypothetical protein JSW52_09875 [Candidatus Coatesbacteria bacterium]|nr:MAG: hypothetical protein JSW52_09875 [Candidatus Coatesbacteria bacterium]
MVNKLKSRPVFVGALVLALLALTVFANDWPQAPTADDMLADDTVSDAIDDAWDDSDAGDKDKRHEEGGWILWCRQQHGSEWQYSFKVVRVASGGRSGITPGNPPEQENCRVVGFFHTHPNPPTDEDGDNWEQGPSESDNNWHNRHKIPGVVRNASGNETFGPERGYYE